MQRHLPRAVSVAGPNRLEDAPRDVHRVCSSNWPSTGGGNPRVARAVVVCDQQVHPRSAERECVRAK